MTIDKDHFDKLIKKLIQFELQKIEKLFEKRSNVLNGSMILVL